MNLQEKGLLFVLFVIVLLPICLLAGWVRNLYLFTQLDFQEPYKAEVIRGIGITPLGGIIGYININDEHVQTISDEGK